MPTLSELEDLLGDSVGANLSFTTELNLVRARLIQGGNWTGTKREISLDVFSDRNGNSIVTPPRQYKTILAGAIRSPSVLCTGDPMGVSNGWTEFSPNGLGYGGLTNNFQEVNGKFCVFREWTDPMRLRFKFEASESDGVIHIKGMLDGEKVFSLYSGSWIEGEKVAFTGITAVTSTKTFDPDDLSIVKPVTLGRVSMYTLDDDEVETLVAVYEPSETVPRWKRYKVPECEDVEPIEATTEPATLPSSQYYTRDELDSLFADAGTITVNSTGTHDLVYAAYFQRRVKVVAQAGVAPYVHSFLLDNSTVKNGGVLRITLDIVASVNPTLKFYNNTVSAPNLLDTTIGDSSNAQVNMTYVFGFNGGDWEFLGRET